MALAPMYSDEAVNVANDAQAALLNTGYIRIYAGTKPTNANTAIGAQTLLATLRFGATAFGASVAGVATANAITSDSDAAATGTASFFRCLKSNGTSVVYDGTVGVSGCDMNMATVALVQHAIISLSSFTMTQPES